MAENKDSAQGSRLDVHDNLTNVHSKGSPTPRQTSASSSSSDAAMRGKREQLNRASSSRNTNSTRAENRTAQRDVRTLPPWIASYEDEEGDDTSPTDRLLSSPPRAHAAQHHHSPTAPPRRISQDGYVDEAEDTQRLQEKKPQKKFFGRHKEPVKGRKWDHARTGDPVIMQSGIFSGSSPWQTYIQSSTYGHGPGEDHEKKDERFLQSQTPGYSKPWRGDLEGGNAEKTSGYSRYKKKRKSFILRFQRIILMHPLVPLFFRVIVTITSLVALSLSSSVDHLSNKYHYAQTPSTTMAIVVDVVAIPYILYVTWDEYTGKPLGLRSAKAKIRLVLVDLLFIIFESANLALAFATLTDKDGACQEYENSLYNQIICDRVKALCGILMLALLAWSITFSVSIFRLVERVGGREQIN